MQEYKRAVKAISVPSRAQELRDEIERASIDDLIDMHERTKNKSKRRRIEAELQKLHDTPVRMT